MSTIHSDHRQLSKNKTLNIFRAWREIDVFDFVELLFFEFLTKTDIFFVDFYLMGIYPEQHAVQFFNRQETL